MDDINEKVLDVAQRQKRAMLLRRHEQKLERAREIAKSKMAPTKNIKKRAYAQARQIVRKRFAGQRGAEYEKLGPSEKMAIDRAIEKKGALIKKLALRLIPRVRQAEQKRLQSFVSGKTLKNQGQPEGKSVSEDLNRLFAERVEEIETTKADKEKSGKAKKVTKNIIVYSKFGEEAECNSPIYKAISKKARKSGVSENTLGTVYDRGLEAWTEETGVTQQQYAFARVNSFINQGKTYFDEDSDLHESKQSDEYNKARRQSQKNTTKALGYQSKASIEYHKRQDAAQRATKALNKTNEEAEPIEELSKDTLKSYAAKAGPSIQNMSKKITDIDSAIKIGAKSNKRMAGMNKAFSKMYKEEVQQTNENFSNIDELSTATVTAYRRGMEKDVAMNPKMDSRKKAQREAGFKTSTKKVLGIAKVNATESLKDPEDNPCWKNYKPVGTKKLRGKTVPNCVPEAVEKVVGTNCRNCSWWKPDSEKPVTKEELNKNGGLKAPNDEYIAMSKRIDLGTLPGEDHNVKVKGFCDHKEIMDWVTERMCCSQWDADGMIRDYKGQSPVMKEEGESIVPQKTSPGSKIRKKIEVVDRKPPHTEYTRQAEIKTKIIDEKLGNSQNDPKKRLMGTDSLVQAYKKDTPGQDINESFNIAYAAGVGVTLTSADLGMRTQGGFSLHPSVIEEMERRAREQEEVEEEVRTADVRGEVIPAHTKTVVDPKSGALKQVTVPGHVRRAKKNKTIIPSGSVTDGEAG